MPNNYAGHIDMSMYVQSVFTYTYDLNIFSLTTAMDISYHVCL